MSELIRLYRCRRRSVQPDVAAMLAPPAPPGPAGASFLARVLRSRIDSTSMDARLAVKTAAVIGEVFSLRLIGRVCPELTEATLERVRREVRQRARHALGRLCRPT